MIVVTGKVSVDQSPVRQSIYQQRMPNTLSSAEKNNVWMAAVDCHHTNIATYLVVNPSGKPTYLIGFISCTIPH